jgi:alkylation response protein AidB-like acyl-CoA dehydrogenase
VAVRVQDNEAESLLRNVFRGFFSEWCTTEVVLDAESTGYHPALWARLGELGAPGMAVGADEGGGGATFADLVVVAEEAGRAGAPVALAEHQLAATWLRDPDVTLGTRAATIALRPSDADGAWRVVPGGGGAHTVVGVHRGETVAVPRFGDGDALPNTGSVALADITIVDHAPLADADAFAPTIDAWRVLTAAQLVGIAGAALASGTDYALTREQFGRPIGGFQAVQHGLADAATMIEGARVLVGKAAWARDCDDPGVVDLRTNEITDARVLASMAFLFATEAASLTVDRVVQYHGAIGCANEAAAQRYYRRARTLPLILGSVPTERRHLADLLLGRP